MGGVLARPLSKAGRRLGIESRSAVRGRKCGLMLLLEKFGVIVTRMGEGERLEEFEWVGLRPLPMVAVRVGGRNAFEVMRKGSGLLH
jgi:hypothetical protein